jgi:F-type H+-transporting ATPase subunit delta
MNILVSRYAEPFYLVAKEAGEVEHVRNDLSILAFAWKNDDFPSFILSPEIKSASKIELLRALLPDASKLTMNFLQLVFERGREEVLVDIYSEFMKRLRKDAGIVSAHATSAVAISEEQRADLAKRLSTSLKKTVELDSKVDESILGGMIVEIEGKRYDGSVSRRLEDLKHEMMG